MMASKYGTNGGAGRGDMRGYNFGPPAGTTTYGGASRLAISRMGPGQGDPGFFDFLGKAVKGVTGLVGGLGIPIVSGVARTVSGFLSGRGPGMPGPAFAPAGAPMMTLRQGVPRAVGLPGPIAATQRAFRGGQTGMGEGCGQGYRPNKSGYYVQGAGGGEGVYVEPNTVCVKRRRMNPLNPRALSKAMRRIESAKRATTVLNRITIRKKC